MSHPILGLSPLFPNMPICESCSRASIALDMCSGGTSQTLSSFLHTSLGSVWISSNNTIKSYSSLCLRNSEICNRNDIFQILPQANFCILLTCDPYPRESLDNPSLKSKCFPLFFHSLCKSFKKASSCGIGRLSRTY